MGMFGVKKIVCPKNQWTILISNKFVQIPISWKIDFKSETGETISGIFSEKKSLWIIPQKAIEGKLENTMYFERGWFNTFYTLKVLPDVDLIAEID